MGEKVLDIDEFFKTIKKHYLIIVVLAVISAAAGVFSTTKMVPIYTATTKVFIGQKNDYMRLYTDEEIQYYQGFMDTFYEVMGINDFMENSLKKYDLKISAPQIKSALNISIPTKSPMFTMTYSGYDEDQVKEVLEAVCDELDKQIDKLGTKDELQIIAPVSVGKLMASKLKRVLLVLGAGIAAGFVIIFVIYYTDDTVKNKEKLESLLPVPVLGEIPEHERKFTKKEKSNANYRRNATINISRGL